LILAVLITPADVQDRDGAKPLLKKLRNLSCRLTVIFADGGYAGQLVDWVRQMGGWTLEIVKRSDLVRGFVVLPKRWIVERTFAWLSRCRRHSKDYERNSETSEAMIFITMIGLMSRRLARAKS
jgi:putative transposase